MESEQLEFLKLQKEKKDLLIQQTQQLREQLKQQDQKKLETQLKIYQLNVEKIKYQILEDFKQFKSDINRQLDSAFAKLEKKLEQETQNIKVFESNIEIISNKNSDIQQKQIQACKNQMTQYPQYFSLLNVDKQQNSLYIFEIKDILSKTLRLFEQNSSSLLKVQTALNIQTCMDIQQYFKDVNTQDNINIDVDKQDLKFFLQDRSEEQIQNSPNKVQYLAQKTSIIQKPDVIFKEQFQIKQIYLINQDLILMSTQEKIYQIYSISQNKFVANIPFNRFLPNCFLTIKQHSRKSTHNAEFLENLQKDNEQIYNFFSQKDEQQTEQIENQQNQKINNENTNNKGNNVLDQAYFSSGFLETNKKNSDNLNINNNINYNINNNNNELYQFFGDLQIIDRYLAIGGSDLDSDVYFYDLQNNFKKLFVLPGHQRAISKMYQLPDLRSLVVGCIDGKLWIWDLQTLTPKAIKQGHNTSIENQQIFNLITSSADGKVMYWDLKYDKDGVFQDFEVTYKIELNNLSKNIYLSSDLVIYCIEQGGLQYTKGSVKFYVKNQTNQQFQKNGSFSLTDNIQQTFFINLKNQIYMIVLYQNITIIEIYQFDKSKIQTIKPIEPPQQNQQINQNQVNYDFHLVNPNENQRNYEQNQQLNLNQIQQEADNQKNEGDIKDYLIYRQIFKDLGFKNQIYQPQAQLNVIFQENDTNQIKELELFVLNTEQSIINRFQINFTEKLVYKEKKN
ncbi:WD40-repeat-containing domain [Pseudocohnilembus persalinus]|uniref:WD40-repeat-containing domain n=1 Tax=Pseudocohnilembus persalinus TaxID=266149 RepID=A0A0V0R4J3_PSEPJ|nr:WD40-repeat-containing domain [Pseudocohnilembus persalinus]|eukprot:KRX09404.1 WD40-repeat-containing domain [Pseudocohnilembus persalinus]